MLDALFDGTAFMAHGYCLLWQPGLLTLHALSDLLIAGSYFAIPIAILIFLRRRPELEMRGLAAMFAAFILLCGITHVIGLVTLWQPIYVVQGLAKALTAGVSILTAAAVFLLIPRALAIPAPAALQSANAALTNEVEAHRRTLAELEAARDALAEQVDVTRRALDSSEERFRIVQEASPDGFMLFDAVRNSEEEIVDFRRTYANAAGAEVLGARPEEIIGRSMLEEMPGHAESGLFTAYRKVVETGDPWQDEFHYAHDGIDGWFRATAVKVADGFAVTFSDISERRKRDAQIRLLMREVNHRAKNLLAVAQAIVRLTATNSDPEAFAHDIGQRLQSLSRSQNLIVAGDWTSVPLADLIETQLAHLGGSSAGRISFSGPAVELNPAAAQAIGLALHELSTNAIKHGALSNCTGRIEIEWSVTGGAKPVFSMMWSESGGPPVVASGRRGFGRVTTERMVKQALDADIALDLPVEGLRWTVTASLESVGEIARPGLPIAS
ncbi:HWE histidine kinase domain-containing protein [Pontivivens ytuae]|uniref:histidine kinase n=1 Tax=Pontivivens ytuae TaxID=2789856 RepID=A0A7S9QBZ5_9RHOB|nr:HWE histidine kinase domain-containing protein [Pontivivens ytuae]QPH53285.1 PAS domain-containing protein [Pontivivens ytuae]